MPGIVLCSGFLLPKKMPNFTKREDKKSTALLKNED